MSSLCFQISMQWGEVGGSGERILQIWLLEVWRYSATFLASLLNLTYWNHFFTDSGLSLHMCIYMHFLTINNWLGAPKCWGIPAKPYNVSRSIVFLPPLRFQFTGCFFFTAVTVTPERFTYQTCSFIYCICPEIWRFEKWKKKHIYTVLPLYKCTLCAYWLSNWFHSIIGFALRTPASTLPGHQDHHAWLKRTSISKMTLN